VVGQNTPFHVPFGMINAGKQELCQSANADAIKDGFFASLAERICYFVSIKSNGQALKVIETSR
jgi:hypothetical protein